MNKTDKKTDAVPPQRGVFCNRTLNLRSIGAIGYDMDYTLIHYQVAQWEKCAYDFGKKHLLSLGWPVQDLDFDAELTTQGLIIDISLGNLLKANRFGYAKRVLHGTKPIDFEQQRQLYSRVIVDHREPRFIFMSTLFSLSESCLYAQLVDLYDAGALPEVKSYGDLYRRVRDTMDGVHSEGYLKAEITAHPEKFVELDAETAETLVDQRDAGKKLLLITNSDWLYTRQMMAYAFDRYMPKGRSWRDLFELVIVSARKPDFFNSHAPLLEVVDDSGLLRPLAKDPQAGTIYFGGNATLVEQHLNLSGDQILFVGDHFFGDVHATKSALRWRTALIVRELEQELKDVLGFADDQQQLQGLMAQKEELELRSYQQRLLLQRIKYRRQNADDGNKQTAKDALAKLRTQLEELDNQIGPLAKGAAELGGSSWGPIMRAGNDKSYVARLVETFADVYTSRVSNFVYQTPFRFFRSARGTLPHDARP